MHASTTSLPARPAPRNFLAGVARQSGPRHQTQRAVLLAGKKQFPGQAESTDGQWSKTYLKRIVLQQMEGRGELCKLTRGKWDRLGALLPVSGAEPVAAGTSSPASIKELEEHVWVEKEEWVSRVAAKAMVINKERLESKLALSA